VRIRDKGPKDQPAVTELLGQRWGRTTVVAHGTEYDAAGLPALIAHDKGIAGLLTYTMHDDGLEIVSLDAVQQRRGIGTALLQAAMNKAHHTGRLWLVTTNDNLDALRFYQRRHMRIVAVAPGAVEEARRIKPEIPEFGHYGIEIRDEITLEMRIR
jgi:GNAT superfamily N-acetyltransferase